MDFWSGNDTLECRNPALCEVCSTWWNLSGDEIDALYEASGLEWDKVMEPFEEELLRKWRAKVANSARVPQRPDETNDMMTTTSFLMELPEEPADP